jgi:PmbA protein
MKNIVEKTLSIAADRKIDQFDVILTGNQSLSLTAQQGKIDAYKVNSSRLIGIRVIHDQKVGISYSEDLSDESLKTMVGSALESSRYAERDELQMITENGAPIIDDNTKTYRDDQTGIQAKIDLALSLESEVKKRDGRTAAVPYNGYAEGEGHHYYGNHLGLRVYEREKSFSCYTSSLLRQDERQALYYRGSQGRTFSELEPEKVIRETLARTETLLNASPIESGTYSVIFETETLLSLLSCFTSLFSGKAVKDGFSSYKDSLGEKIAHPEFTLRDLPRYEDGFSFSLTDAEGVKKEDLTLIQQGILKSFYHNSVTARHFGVKNTGHGSRSAKGHLGTSLSQLLIEPGSTPESSLLAGKTLKIFNLEGLHAGVNASSGAFSLAAGGELHENGNPVRGIKGITLSGNFFDLIKNIEGIGNRLKASPDRGFFSPDIRFGGIKVAGS